MIPIPTFISSLGWTIVHSTWQIVLIAGIVKLLLTLFHGQSPAVKYNIVLTGLFGIFTAFCITMVMMTSQPVHDISDVNFSNTMEGISEGGLSGSQTGNFDSGNVEMRDLLSNMFLTIDRSIHYVFWIWFAGFLFFTMRFAGGFLYIRRLRNRYSFKAEAKWQELLDRINEKLEIRRGVALMESAATGIPIVLGALKPMVILPLGLATHIPFNQLEAILVHELAHISRNDYLVNLFINVVRGIFFYHPLFWWLTNKLETCREHACDDLTVAYCGSPEPLQKALLDLSTLNQKPIPVAAALYKNDYQLLKRIMRMKTQIQKTNGKRFNPGGLLGLMLLFIVLAGGSSFAPRPDDHVYPIEVTGGTDHLNTASFSPVEPVTAIGQTNTRAAQPVPDSTVKKVKAPTPVAATENTKGIVSLEIDAEGNLVGVKKDGKELTGEERAQYDKMAEKFMQMKVEQERMQENKQALAEVQERLKDAEARMKEVQTEYSEVMEDYLRLQSESGNQYRDAWSLYNEALANSDYAKQWSKQYEDVAGIYNQQLKENMEFWQQHDQQWWQDQYDSNRWEEYNEQMKTMMEQQEKEANWMAQHKAEQLAQMETMWKEQEQQMVELQKMKEKEMNFKAFEAQVRHELVKDGLLDDADGDVDFEMSVKRLVVNGNKQSAEAHKKYMNIYKEHTDRVLSGSERVVIHD